MAKTVHIPGEWMYSAPEKAQPAAAPAQQEKPMASFFAPEDDQCDEPRRQYFKDSDTPYIRMAKEGGRRDLLMPKPQLEFHPSSQAVPYRRCEWFYLEDQAAQEAALQAKQPPSGATHVPSIPDYMIHDPVIWAEIHEGEGPSEPGPKARVPYATWNDAQLAKQNVSKAPSASRSGVSKVSKTSATRSKPVVPRGELEDPASRFVPLKPRGEQQVDMSKLLSNQYVEEFQKQRTDWQKRQSQADVRRASNPNAPKLAPGKLTTEYREKVGKPHK